MLKFLTERQEMLIFQNCKVYYFLRNMQNKNLADVAELADAQASGACGLRPVEVRLLSSALNQPYESKNPSF